MTSTIVILQPSLVEALKRTRTCRKVFTELDELLSL